MAALQHRMALAKQHYERVQNKKLKNIEMAEYCKVSKVSVGQWFNGPTQALEGANLTLAAEFLGVSPKWLSGRGGAMVDRTPQSDEEYKRLQLSKRLRVPLVNMAQADQWHKISEDILAKCRYVIADYLGRDPDAVFGVTVEGLSMIPQFEPGDLLIVDAAKVPKPGDFVIAKCGDHEATLRKYRVTGYDDDGHANFELIPLNPDFPALSSVQQKIIIIGVVVKLNRHYK